MVESHLKKKSHADAGSADKLVSEKATLPQASSAVKTDQPRVAGRPVKSGHAVPDEPEDRREMTRDMGLCKHCERRTTCPLPCPEGGVWHCDDYV